MDEQKEVEQKQERQLSLGERSVGLSLENNHNHQAYLRCSN